MSKSNRVQWTVCLVILAMLALAVLTFGCPQAKGETLEGEVVGVSHIKVLLIEYTDGGYRVAVGPRYGHGAMARVTPQEAQVIGQHFLQLYPPAPTEFKPAEVRKHIRRELAYRAEVARQYYLAGNPVKGWGILNGQDSSFTYNPKYIHDHLPFLLDTAFEETVNAFPEMPEDDRKWLRKESVLFSNEKHDWEKICRLLMEGK